MFRVSISYHQSIHKLEQLHIIYTAIKLFESYIKELA